MIASHYVQRFHQWEQREAGSMIGRIADGASADAELDAQLSRSGLDDWASSSASAEAPSAICRSG